jgi:CRISPR-associated protein Csb2
LEEVYRSFRESVRTAVYSPPIKPTVFSRVVYSKDTALPVRPFAIFEFEEEVAFRQEDVAIVAAMLRSCACKLAKRDTHEFPGGSEVYVAGHATGGKPTPPRFSFVPLPTVGHTHSDGMIRRVLIVEPYGGDGAQARWAQRALRSSELVDEVGIARTLLIDPWRKTGVLERYIGAGDCWSTVTPVVLPGHDDHDLKRKAPALFMKAVEQAGIPTAAVQDFNLSTAPSWPGSQHPREYRRPSYLKHLPAWHARIRFHERIGGPLAIGAGRHCGLGIFARCS